MILLSIVIAVFFDQLWGEPKRYHPLVGYGNSVQWLEQKLWTPTCSKRHGVVAVLITLTALSLLVYCLEVIVAGKPLLTVLVVSGGIYFAIAPKSLREHAQVVSDALDAGDVAGARYGLSRMVSRDTDHLNEEQIAAACCESVLENGSDGIFAALFWFCLFAFFSGENYPVGLYGVVLYRGVNTLDAMWGYKNTRYRQFGWAAARLDDILNYLPARLVGLSYAVMGNYLTARHCWLDQGPKWKSPNAGVVMASGAGSLEITLGGDSVYDGKTESRTLLGCGRAATPGDIARALALVNRTLLLWLLVIAVLNVVVG